MHRPLLLTVLLALPLAAAPASGQRAEAATVPAGRYVPLYAAGADSGGVEVAGFILDVRPVTVAEYLRFVRDVPAWRRDRVAPALAEGGYLSRWAGVLDPGAAAPPDRPVTEVSWFAARAYCRWAGGRLPTTNEWEYAAQLDRDGGSGYRNAAFHARVLEVVQRRAPLDGLPAAGTTDRGAFGLRDLHGLVWEWTADFNNQMLTGAGRDDRGLDRGLFCASGSVGTTDLGDYAAFLRWAHRTSLEGSTAGARLGFRCAR